jgi:hypothetical protein
VARDALVTLACVEAAEAKALLERTDTRRLARRQVDDLIAEALDTAPASRIVANLMRGIKE